MKAKGTSVYLTDETLARVDAHAAGIQERDGLRVSRSSAIESLLRRALAAIYDTGSRSGG